MDVKPFIESFRDINRRVVRLIDSLSALTDLSALQPHAEEEAVLLERMLQTLLQHDDFERCSFFVLQGERLVNVAGLDWQDLVVHGRHHTPVAVESAVFEFAEAVIARAAATGELYHCGDCARNPRVVDKHGSEGAVGGSLLCVPVVASGSVLGVLSVYHPCAERFTASHERFLQLFSGFAGQILFNARYAQHLEHQIQARTQQLEQALVKTAELKDQFEQLSIIDELTELHNRRFFFPEAQASLARALRYGHAFSVLLIDLDHFKRVNDEYGHATGDRILRTTGDLLKAQTREGDLVARFGGEEFVLALPNTDGAGSALLAQRILAVLRSQPWDRDIPALQVSASIGVAALSPPPGHDSDAVLDTLLSQADQALYEAKKAGRDCYRLYPGEG